MFSTRDENFKALVNTLDFLFSVTEAIPLFYSFVENKTALILLNAPLKKGSTPDFPLLNK